MVYFSTIIKKRRSVLPTNTHFLSEGMRMTFNKKSRKSCQKGPKHHENEGKCINFDQQKAGIPAFSENSHACE